jgi:hypothetical protein
MNAETERIIDRALVAKGLDTLPTWPGIEVAVTTESYLAILGTFYLLFPWDKRTRPFILPFKYDTDDIVRSRITEW